MEPAEMEILTDPAGSESIRTAAVAAAIVGVMCGVVGCYVVLRGMAIMAEGLAHGVMPGVGIAFALTAGAAGESASDTALTAGALAAALATAVGTSFVLSRSRLREDTASAVVFVFMLALGVAIVSSIDGYGEHLEEFLFGDVLGVGWGEIALTAAVTIAVLGMVAILYRPFLMLSFDRKRAAALGMPVDRLQLLMLAILAIAVVVGFRVVGVLLVLGLLIAPAAAAALVTKRLPAMMAISAAIAALSGPLGLLASWHLDVAAGPAIVIVAVAAFGAALSMRPAVR
jgi:ABC-type Mn2+/Zn2+ transport system permease subunit